MLIDVYLQAELKPDTDNKAKLLTLLHLFDSDEPTRKKFIGDMIGLELLRIEDIKKLEANFL